MHGLVTPAVLLSGFPCQARLSTVSKTLQFVTPENPAMGYTLGQAALATGKTKTAIAEAIKKGRISAKRDESGRYHIDPAELHRVYKPVSSEQSRPVSSDAVQELTHTVKLMEAQLKAMTELKEQIATERDDLRLDRDHWRTQAQATLTDQRAKATEPAPRRRWFSWK